MSEGVTDVDARITLATHTVEIANMKKAQEAMAAKLEETNQLLHEINTTLSEAKGGWRMLMLVGGAGGALGALANHIFHTIPGGK